MAKVFFDISHIARVRQCMYCYEEMTTAIVEVISNDEAIIEFRCPECDWSSRTSNNRG